MTEDSSPLSLVKWTVTTSDVIRRHTIGGDPGRQVVHMAEDSLDRGLPRTTKLLMRTVWVMRMLCGWSGLQASHDGGQGRPDRPWLADSSVGGSLS